MTPIQLHAEQGVEITIRATQEAYEQRARLCAEAIAQKLGLDNDRAEVAALPLQARLPRHKLERVQAFVEDNLGRRLRVEDMSAVAHMSPFHFTRVFKRSTGLAPHAYLTFRRIERAKRLLSESSLALVEIAASVGFQTQGHFTEVFRRVSGTTPRRYRVQQGGP